MDPPAEAPPPDTSSWLGLLAYTLYCLVYFTTITLPSVLFHILSYTLTLTLDFYTLAILLGLVLFGVYLLFRYRLLMPYSRLPVVEGDKRSPNDGSLGKAFDLVVPGTNGTESKTYPGEFLSAFLGSIQIFGYLDPPVFEELARSLRTRTLRVGETIEDARELEQAFYTVIEGRVQVYAKSSLDAGTFREMHHPSFSSLGSSSLPRSSSQSTDPSTSFNSSPSPPPDSWGSDKILLTDVGKGGTLSSLFSTLSLFTHAQDSMDVDLETQSAPVTPGPDISTDKGSLPNKIPLHRSFTSASHTLHSDIAFRASEPTTLAYIPAEAFRRVIQSHPSAIAHVIQVILTRFSRVTFRTLYAYLGLRTDLLLVESGVEEMAGNEEEPGVTRIARSSASPAFPPSSSSSSPPSSHIPYYPNFSISEIKRLRARYHPDQSIVPKNSKASRLDSEEGDTANLSDGGLMMESQAGRRRPRHQQSRQRRPSRLASDRLDDEEVQVTETESDIGEEEEEEGGSIISGSPSSSSPLSSDILSDRSNQRSPSDVPRPNLPEQDLQSPSHDQAYRPSLTETGRRSMYFVPTLFNSTGQKTTSSGPARLFPQGHTPSKDEDEFMQLKVAALKCLFRRLGLFGPGLEDALAQRATHASSSYSGASPAHSGPMTYPLDSPTLSTSSASSASSSSLPNNRAQDTLEGSEGAMDRLVRLLRDKVAVKYYPKGDILVHQGSSQPGLMVVLDGALDVWVERPQSEANRMAEGPEKRHPRREKLFVVQPGGVAGYLAALTGSASFVTIRAAINTCVAFLPKEALDRVVERYPRLILLLARKLVGQLTPLILHVDFALEWLQVEAGKELYHQGAPSDSVHIVLNGRLRTVMEESGRKPRVLAEHGQGDSLGEVEMLSKFFSLASLPPFLLLIHRVP